MDPRRSGPPSRYSWLPRTRGDGPRAMHAVHSLPAASPHTRGWTPCGPAATPAASGFPAHAGMDPGSTTGSSTGCRLPRTRGDGPVHQIPARRGRPASPHTRGWTRNPGDRQRGRSGFPAHAGMDRGARSAAATRPGLPRTRGDGPYEGSIRGGSYAASPHTRGWTDDIVGQRPVVEGFPAHAGMDPPAS